MKRLIDRLRTFFAKKQKATPPKPEAELPPVRWLAANETPFGIEVLDCRPYATTMTALTGDPQVAARFLSLRNSLGEELRGTKPEGAKLIECNLVYPYQGEVKDGVLFKAEVMEDKWDIYLYDGYLYFARSWTGTLIFRVKSEFAQGAAKIVAVETASQDDDHFVLQQVDFLIKSHLFERDAPHPLPQALGRDAHQLAIYSFSMFGRRRLYGTLSDTLKTSA